MNNQNNNSNTNNVNSESGNLNASFEHDESDNATQRLPFDIIEKNNDEYQDDKSKMHNNNSYSMYIKKFMDEHKSGIKASWIILFNALVGGYFAWSTYYFIDLKNKNDRDGSSIIVNDTETTAGQRCPGYCGIQWCDGYGMLIILLIFIYVGVFYFQVLKPIWGKSLKKRILQPLQNGIGKLIKIRFSKIVLLLLVLAVFLVFIIFDTSDARDRLRSLVGIFGLLFLGFVFSKNRSKIIWRPVICGLIFQFILGVFCIRWVVGRSIFQCLGNKVATFLAYAREGSQFVYGLFLVQTEGVFAFAVLPVIYFFSFIISVLYYLGAMQWIVTKLGWILQAIIGTTVCESVICAANIFLGMSESPLLIRPYIKYLTHSEIHTIMASGFATVSGTVLAAYISFGAEPSHLITSSVMAAPAALCFAKLFWPETEVSQTSSHNIVMEKSKDTSVLDAAANGANTAISLVFGILANLVAFVSFIAFINGIVNWLGYLVGLDFLSFEWIFSKLFIPLAWIMGVQWEDCENVGILIATKTIINEFVAYQRLGEMKRLQEISLRSSAIATYAICGFANPSSLGICIGALSAMCPEKRGVITAVAFRAFVSGCIICFITASIAGLLMTEDISSGI